MHVKTGSDITTVYYGCASSRARADSVDIQTGDAENDNVHPVWLLRAGYDCRRTHPLAAHVSLGGGHVGRFGCLLHGVRFRPVALPVSGDHRKSVGVSCVFAICVGGATGPLLVGNLFPRYGHMWVIYVPFAALLLKMAIFFSIEAIAKRNGLKSEPVSCHKHVNKNRENVTLVPEDVRSLKRGAFLIVCLDSSSTVHVQSPGDLTYLLILGYSIRVMYMYEKSIGSM